MKLAEKCLSRHKPTEVKNEAADVSGVIQALIDAKPSDDNAEQGIIEGKTEEVIQALIDTDWSKDNESQMKAVQLLKGIALSDDASANAFMKKMDTFTSGLKAE